MKVVLLMGGWSGEREVSLMSGKAVLAALHELGHEVLPIDLQPGLAQFDAILKFNPDVVFNALHGQWGEDGRVQGVLDLLGIAYTHSGVLASALAMNKQKAKEVMKYHGVPVPGGSVYTKESILSNPPTEYPLVLKPLCEGSTIGVHIVHSEKDLQKALLDDHLGEEFLAERYIKGREFSCAVLNGRALGVIEIVPKSGFYDYKAKYSSGQTEHLMPAPLRHDEEMAIRRYSEITFAAIGCNGLARVDFRYDEALGLEKGLFALEINTQPGCTALSLAPEMARYVGISFPELVAELLSDALERKAKDEGVELPLAGNM